MSESRRRSRIKLVLLAAVFVAPVVASYATFYLLGPLVDDPASHGQLLDPPRPLFTYPESQAADAVEGPARPRPMLARAGLEDLEHAPLDPAGFRGQWTMLYIAGGRCGESCRQRLYDTRQVRTATGRDRGRIRRVLLMIETTDRAGLAAFLARQHPTLVATFGELPQVAPLAEFFSPAGGESVSQVIEAGRVYLIDPLGNWFMFYRPEQPAEGILEDLERVMRASFIG